MKRSIVLWVAGATAVASLAGMGAVSTLTNDVTLVVDGQASVVRAHADTVAQVLGDNDITLGVHDAVSPGATTSVKNGMRITVAYGRQVDVMVDGVAKTVWTTGSTVDGVLAGMGITDPDAMVTPDRSTKLTGDGVFITVSLPKLVQVTADGVTTTMQTLAATVGDLLSAQGVNLGADDIVTPTVDTPLTDTTSITVQRVATTEETETVAVPFDTTNQDDPTLAEGQTQVQTQGVDGAKDQVWQITTVDGVEQSRTLVSETVTVAPTTEVVLVGTQKAKQAVTSAASSSSSSSAASVPPPSDVTPGSAQDIARGMLASFGFGDDQFGCLVNLWNHESGWRVNASNKSSGAYGIPQALPGSKMASAGADWQTNPATQISWGLSYIKSRYGTPCGAWSSFQSHGWY